MKKQTKKTKQEERFKKVVEWNADWIVSGVILLTFGSLLIFNLIIKYDKGIWAIGIGICIIGVAMFTIAKRKVYYKKLKEKEK